MLLIKCPYCEEERPELEFRNAGEAHLVRAAPIVEQSDDDFAAYLYFRQNPKGLQFERWRHIHGCGRFFNAVRDSVSDKFLTVYKAGEPRPNVELLLSRPAASPDPVEQPASTRAPRAKKAEV
ncbi:MULTISPECIES: sarcosine oxidase subunit delta [Phyllobacterium]|jgi:sarcosine oxidase, subunit delta|uniref:Sarcosine oxidase subunit delta n=1 Tax=Phyllobacterium sophorae TaxID=1520277 RepID=A0A2P7BE37_9HYPH|nr:MULTISPECIES: sarcosine oxidase subunit delta [Phyllobacterium]PSH64689.1 sarcosine oxidase subunit delta [Phyllobacterium sophorae]UXN64921.1 sarcosine oxidase subunit delta [Phyllobacterium sp. A18/5-2]